MALLLFALCLQGLVYGQKPKETDFCALELHPGIDTSWVDSRFAPLITKAAVPHPSMVIYELILDFEFEFEKLAALFEYRFQGNSCHYTAYRVDGSVIGNLSGQRRFDATELGHALQQVAGLGGMTILKHCHLLDRDFGDTRTLLFIQDGIPVLVLHMVGGHDLYFYLEQPKEVDELLGSYLWLKSKMG